MSSSGDNNIVHRRVAEKKYEQCLKRLNVTNKQNHINTDSQIRKQKLQPNRQTIGAIDNVPQLILSFFKYQMQAPDCFWE
ncbi:unnamed protein product [Rotaria sordida]|uniref:Uncharacterized protein n=1 Tax=Rotaria sordida TaxID=392033 RepID=A0A813UC38_9BILA|nr:unnamed protein product [Rotaria sordida]